MIEFVGADATTTKKLTDATILVIMITNFVLGGFTLPLLKVLGLTTPHGHGSSGHGHGADDSHGKKKHKSSPGPSRGRRNSFATFSRQDILPPPPSDDTSAIVDAASAAAEEERADADAALQVRTAFRGD